eukprot:g7538.t1
MDLSRSGQNEYVYTLQQMPEQEIIECIFANKAYNPRGDCKYCSSCDGTLCTCQSSASCESFLPKAAAVVCLALALLLLVIAVRSSWKWAKGNVLYRVRPDELPELQEKPQVPLKVWERRPSMAIFLPGAGCVLFFALGVVVWFSPNILTQEAAS